MNTYEKFAEVYFMLDNYSNAIDYLEISLNMAKKFNNIYFIEHINSILAWTYYRLDDYEKSLEYLNYNTELIDHRIIIPDTIIKSLVYFSLGDKTSLKAVIHYLNNEYTLQHINLELANLIYELFELFINDDNYIRNPLWEELLIKIINNIKKLIELKKVFTTLLKQYYIINRRYKDALFL